MMNTQSEPARLMESNMGIPSCPCCSGDNIRIFYRVKGVPVNSVLNVLTRKEALHFPCGDISLGLCRGCGFIYNTAFEPGLVTYCSKCEESQGYSPTFRSFARSVARGLVETYSLYNKTIIEIGCGKGEFLNLLCNLGGNRGIGFDPAYVPGHGTDVSDHRLTFITDYYSDRYSDYQGDFVCCKMTLEHISEARELVETVRRSIGHRTDTIVFFQVPNMLRVLRDCAFEDIYYEHCSYFTPNALARLFSACEFAILNLKTVYDDQYICIEAKPTFGNAGSVYFRQDELTQIDNYVTDFEQAYNSMLSHWKSLLNRYHQEGRQIVIWGAGSKAVSFLSILWESWFIYCVVDINPHRQGTYMPGTGQKIISPDELKSYQPDVVIIMNPVYRDEISRTLSDLGLRPEIHVMGEHVIH